MPKFSITNGSFFLNDKKFRILSGAMHYFRVHPEYWKDRMQKIKMMGLNTVETYCSWNLHERTKGAYNFEGFLDIEEFIKIAQEVGLYVIVRPGPYICSEWDMGGLPAWLLKDKNMQLRCFYEPYLDAVKSFYNELLPRLKPYLIENGGPIIAVQVENEYGSYGNDKKYLEFMRELTQKYLPNCLLFTSDGYVDYMLGYGTLDNVFKTINFGSNAKLGFENLHRFQTGMPDMCMEFWNGWFDHWGEKHHTRDPEDVAIEIDQLLSLGGSVNFYMVHGGTNFGFMNGANFDTTYRPTISSYDSDAPIDECGNITPKFRKVREVIGKFHELPEFHEPEKVKTMEISDLKPTHFADLFSYCSILDSYKSITPKPMEDFDCFHGYIIYETFVNGERTEAELNIRELHDRAHIFANDTFIGVLEREFPERIIKFSTPKEGLKLTILVENMGRINYGNRLHDRKGITESVMLGSQILFDWKITPLSLDNLDNIKFCKINKDIESVPAFYKFNFYLNDEIKDTFLYPEGFRKGVAFLNGFNLGRYWKRGPQQTLYVPKFLFRNGENELVLFETDDLVEPKLSFIKTPIIDVREND
ncbi:MAG: beta-galactosidase [Candidatus Delongbacteria bacterium]|nr:beta-galactosidase [Candidatus Delongbacteria bacterium]MBN2834280.1 beta-galactosidase [Candidatus Delongbacteria bacterium]